MHIAAAVETPTVSCTTGAATFISHTVTGMEQCIQEFANCTPLHTQTQFTDYHHSVN